MVKEQHDVAISQVDAFLKGDDVKPEVKTKEQLLEEKLQQQELMKLKEALNFADTDNKESPE